jgi:hypothetical protein
MPTVFSSSKVSTSSICGYLWHRSTASNKPSPLSSNLCACPAGTYCPSGSLAASTPLTCTVGSYCAKGSTDPAPCPSGHFCPSPLLCMKSEGVRSGFWDVSPGGRGCWMVLPVTGHEILCRLTSRQSRSPPI